MIQNVWFERKKNAVKLILFVGKQNDVFKNVNEFIHICIRQCFYYLEIYKSMCPGKCLFEEYH